MLIHYEMLRNAGGILALARKSLIIIAVGQEIIEIRP
jgi:hypothetical protein